jgi:subtilisin family serine protease
VQNLLNTNLIFSGEIMAMRPFTRLSGLPSDNGNALSEEPGFAPGMTEAPPVATDILLQFSPAADPAQVKAALQAVNGQQAELVRAGDAEAGPLLRVVLPEGQDLQGAVEILSQQPGVVFAETNQFVNIASGDAADVSGMAEADDIQIEAISNDTGYLNGSLWGMEGDQTAIKNQYGSQAGEAWTAGYTGNMKTVVGVVDTGIDYTHVDLYLNIWLNQGEIPVSFKAQLKDIDKDGLITFRDLNNAANSAFVTDKNSNGRIDAGDLLKDTRWANGNDQDGNGYIDDLIGWDFANNDNDPYDDNGHGTHVAGTIGGIGGNGEGVAGVNWSVQIVATKFLSASGSGNTANAVKSVDYFTTAANLAGSSQNFVATNNSWGGGGSSQAMLDAITRAAKADILFVAAAGNSTSNNDVTANFPSNYNTKATAGYDSVIAVASLTNTGDISSFSSYGATQVDLAAPGSSIYSTLPGSTYGTLSGTSMATPHVAGAAALYASANPNATAADIKAAILGTVDATTSLSGKVATNGRLDVGNLMAGKAAPPVVAPTEIVKITAVLDNVGAVQGIIQAGGTTDDTTPTLQGTLSAALSAGESLVVYHNGVKAGLAAVSGTSWSFTESTLVAAAWSFTARVENTAGAAGSYSAAYAITIDLGPNYIYGTQASESRAGTAGRDIMSGLPSAGSYLGKGSIDKLTGGAGNDIFVLGDSRGVFYDDGLSNNAGTADYVQVMDFQTGDQVQLSSKASGYFGALVTLGGRSGLGIYVDSNGNKSFDSTDELIGHLVGATALKATDIIWA